MNIDDVKYGNLRQSHFDKIKEDKAGMLSKAIKAGVIEDILQNYPFPANSSNETKKELEYLNKLTDSATEEDRKFCIMMEDYHYDFFERIAKDLGMVGVDKDLIREWVSEIDPIIFYLKHKFNRPRPYQLAYHLGIDLYPIIATNANSGAYPSGHTMDFLVILFRFSKLRPDLVDKFNRIYERVENVRQLSGVHYPSDKKVSEILFSKLVKAGILR
jgi:acid phosphatase (class A)